MFYFLYDSSFKLISVPLRKINFNVPSLSIITLSTVASHNSSSNSSIKLSTFKKVFMKSSKASPRAFRSSFSSLHCHMVRRYFSLVEFQIFEPKNAPQSPHTIFVAKTLLPLYFLPIAFLRTNSF